MPEARDHLPVVVFVLASVFALALLVVDPSVGAASANFDARAAGVGDAAATETTWVPTDTTARGTAIYTATPTATSPPTAGPPPTETTARDASNDGASGQSTASSEPAGDSGTTDFSEPREGTPETRTPDAETATSADGPVTTADRPATTGAETTGTESDSRRTEREAGTLTADPTSGVESTTDAQGTKKTISRSDGTAVSATNAAATETRTDDSADSNSAAGPGFGALVAVAALLVALGLLRRQD